ncbi:hypothetical protein D9M69_670120 [compost metagenome]
MEHPQFHQHRPHDDRVAVQGFLGDQSHQPFVRCGFRWGEHPCVLADATDPGAAFALRFPRHGEFDDLVIRHGALLA